MNEATLLLVTSKIKSGFLQRKNRKSLPSKANLDTKTTQILPNLISEVVSEANPQ